MVNDKITEVLERGVEKIYPSTEALEKVLRSGKKIRLYQGFDPSMPNLHLGNTVGLLKLRQFQDLGHEVIMLIGDFTGMIGDPTDKSATRRQLTREQVLENSRSWKKQASKILSFDGENPAKILFNSEWNDKISLKEFIEVASNFSAQQMLERDFFQKRLKDGKIIHLHEFLYPVIQAIDCVAMDVDLEIGGSDQTFNMLCGRDYMKKVKGKEKFVLTMKLLEDNQGQKVGKTAGNALFLNASAEEMFGGIMSFPDETIIPGFELLTTTPMEKIEEYQQQITSGANPMEIKKQLALAIVAIHHGENTAKSAAAKFREGIEGTAGPNEQPISYSALNLGATISQQLKDIGAVDSKSEAKRLVKQGSIDINGETITDPNATPELSGGDLIKVGKRKSFRIK